jgi:uncharacterized protein YndB with AHSA1/START domain
VKSTQSSAVGSPNPVGTHLTPGTAQISVLVPADMAMVWAALTERDVVGRWFGDLSGTLTQSGTYRLDFGDGDFFEIDDVVSEPPHRLSYQWRFLGTGPRNAIDWSIEPLKDQCRVRVTDAEASRTPAGVAEMIEGWTDFLRRLRDYCATGQNTRYAWRQEFDGSIELPIAAADAFDWLTSDDGQRHWLPWSASAIAPGTPVVMTDNGQPANLTIATVNRDGKLAARFSLACPQWLAPTNCSIEVRPWPRGSLLVISHTGWQAISARDSDRATQRHRFSALWIQALRMAQQYVRR